VFSGFDEKGRRTTVELELRRRSPVQNKPGAPQVLPLMPEKTELFESCRSRCVSMNEQHYSRYTPEMMERL